MPSTLLQSGRANSNKHSLFQRVGLFVKKPYLDWSHTQAQLDPQEERQLRQQFIARRERQLSGKESHRDLQQLRAKIGRNRAQAERIAEGKLAPPAAEKNFASADQDTIVESQLSHPRPMNTTIQRGGDKTIPMHFEGSVFTLSPHVAEGQGYEVKTVDAGNLESNLDEAAYCFANGDEISAEAILLQACEDFKDERARIYPYLLDLYRITNQTQPFAAAAALYSQAAKVPMGMISVTNEPTQYARVSAPERTITLDDVLLMDRAFFNYRQSGTSCEFRFDGVTRVSYEALKPLGRLLDVIASTPSEFAFSGLATLINALEQQSKELLATQSVELHRARFCAARLAGNLKLFEQAAEDFSEAAKTTPPAWRAPRCMLLVALENHAPTSNGLSQTGRLLFSLKGSMSKAQLEAELVTQNPFIAHAKQIEINCNSLHALSFDAAALLIDWSRATSSVGAQVHCLGLHRLNERLLLSLGAEAKWLKLSHPYA